jgi:hypothetical protein
MVLMFTVVSLSLGTGLVITTRAVSDATRSAVQEVSSRYPLVIGPKVGAVPLVLGALTRLSGLEGGIDLDVWESLARDPRVERVVPLLLGHAVSGVPLVGTSLEHFEPRPRYALSLGRLFEMSAHEAVAGSEVAATLGLSLGDELLLEHRHGGPDEAPTTLKVVGILDHVGDDADRTVFTSVHTVIASHGHAHQAHSREPEPGTDQTAPAGHAHDAEKGHIPADDSGAGVEQSTPAGHAHDAEPGPDHVASHAHAADAHSVHQHDHGARLSAVLVVPVDRAALMSIQEDYLRRGGLEVAFTAQTLRRIADRLSATGDLVHLLATGVTLLSLLSLAFGVYVFALHGARETAILRLLGAQRKQAALVTAVMGFAVAVASLAGSLLVGAAFSRVAQGALRSEMGFDATVSILSPQSMGLLAWITAGLLGIVLLPTLAIYRSAPLDAVRQGRGRRPAGTWGRWIRAALGVLLILGFFQATQRTGAPTVDIPIDASSLATFRDLATWDPAAPPPPAIAALDGSRVVLMGYMYLVDSPFSAREFHLVGQNPRLAHCPFCYRAPTRTERILVRSPGSAREITPGPVRVSGTIRVDADAPDPVALDLDTFEVVTERPAPDSTADR